MHFNVLVNAGEVNFPRGFREESIPAGKEWWEKWQQEHEAACSHLSRAGGSEVELQQSEAILLVSPHRV